MEQVFKTYTYEPNKNLQGKRNYNSLIILVIALFGLGLMFLEFYRIGAIIMFPSIVILGFMRFATLGKTQSLEGELVHPLLISKEEIRIRNQVFKIDEIEIIKLNCFQYRNQLGRHFSSGLNEHIKSNGAMNYLWFKSNGKDYKYYFRINSESHLNQILEIKKEMLQKSSSNR